MRARGGRPGTMGKATGKKEEKAIQWQKLKRRKVREGKACELVT